MPSRTVPGLSPPPSRPRQHLSRPREHPAIAAYPQRRGFSSPLLSPRLSPPLSCSVKVKLGSREPPLPIQPLPWHCAGATRSGPRYECCRLPGTSYAGLTMKEPRGFSHQAGLPPGKIFTCPEPGAAPQGAAAAPRVAPTLLQIRRELQPGLSPPAPILPSSRGACKPGTGKRSLHAGWLQTLLHQPDPTAVPSSFPLKNSPPHAIPLKFWRNGLGDSQSCCPRLSLRLQKLPCPSPSSLPAAAAKMSQPGPCAGEHPHSLRLLPMPRRGIQRCPGQVPPWPC